MELFANITNRWATSDGSLTFPTTSNEVHVTCGEVSVTATVKDGIAAVSLSDAKNLMPGIGLYELVATGNDSETVFFAERVSNRYTDKQTIIDYGRQNNDGFDDAGRFTDADFARNILAAEESIERGCGRSFCRRKIDVVLLDDKLNELPVVDAHSIESDDEGLHLISYCQTNGVDKPTHAVVTYGAALDSKIAMATTRLAASFMRPRATPENARGTSQDGVYISYELPTGDEGSWTGIPFVDAAIEEHRSRRVVIG